MMNIYKYIFYRTYVWQLKLWGAKDVPEFKAMLVVWFVILCNIFTFALLLQVFGLISVFGLSKSFLLIVFTIVAVLLYLLLVRQGIYKAIIKEFEKESSKQRALHALIMWLFIVGSFAINFIIIGMFLK
jgi:antibiotic biosynthesis monooxygenase (ABM) superfamily enzyme